MGQYLGFVSRHLFTLMHHPHHLRTRHHRHPKFPLPVYILAAGILLVPSACRAQGPPKAAVQPPLAVCLPSPDDAAIYSAALTKVILKDPDDKRQIVLLAQTSSAYPPGMAAFTSLAKPDRTELLDLTNPATKADFDARAKLSCDLTANPRISDGIVFVSPKERDELFSKNNDPWKDFAKKYPNAGGFTIVSPIGFNAPHHQALVYVGNSCGMLCGTGYLVLVEKKKDKWIAAKTAKIWISS